MPDAKLKAAGGTQSPPGFHGPSGSGRDGFGRPFEEGLGHNVLESCASGAVEPRVQR